MVSIRDMVTQTLVDRGASIRIGALWTAAHGQQLDLEPDNGSTRPVKHRTLAGFRREVIACVVTFRPVSESSVSPDPFSSPLFTLHQSTPRSLDILLLSKKPATHY
ncbi:hypothetical protein EVAR_4325_1 [Eumeta japonica]|uniref:Uncharacterized protein n=1 Tax=Eumeta variegata TaxID=151549 RepID=A0A4C1VBD8_EUMVA|nr:hypothetical protein EVAR_4325_1 [Eumeta japonica]